MTVYIIRHGETEFNQIGIVQGRGVDSDLNATGHAQAAHFFDQYASVPFDFVMVSSLKRTHQTVAGFIEQKKIPHQKFPDLDEISWGTNEGKAPTAEMSEIFRRITTDWENGIFDSKIENGESAADLNLRCRNVVSILENMASKKNSAQHKNVLICTHGRTISCLVTILRERPLSDINAFKNSNTGLYTFRYKNGKFIEDLKNDTRHLNGH